ncbi:LOB DOMAIN-CONTAINING PROTEIN 42-LIKE [Salix purpurea]|uniref:LOB DOMAIN-CONTAINING PROTEIN 42-LIKE n=1 Tax=Salix purpurea TaxID=77065 RepID=A0A9Q0Z9K7_SALPP|nr:LOB DOMAIN-CONTAINING PROTEIN 42-LIKE [Salix purpurea]
MRLSCNGCRVLRKGCSDSCILRPCLQWIKTPDSQANATLFLAKFYGRAGLINLIEAGHPKLRQAIFRSLLYEACGRIVNPVYGSVGMLWSGNWAQCQAAVDAVLKGSPIMSLPSTSEVPAPHLISSLNTYDIRHVSRDQECSPGLTKVKNQTRFKRSVATRPNSQTEPTRQDKPVEWVFEPARDSCLHHLGKGDSYIKDEESIFSVETVEGSLWSHLGPDRVFKFNGQSDGNDVSLDLTLGLVSE